MQFIFYCMTITTKLATIIINKGPQSIKSNSSSHTSKDCTAMLYEPKHTFQDGNQCTYHYKYFNRWVCITWLTLHRTARWSPPFINHAPPQPLCWIPVRSLWYYFITLDHTLESSTASPTTLALEFCYHAPSFRFSCRLIHSDVLATGGQQPSKINYEISKSLRFQDFKRFQDFMFQDCNKISRLARVVWVLYRHLRCHGKLFATGGLKLNQTITVLTVHEWTMPNLSRVWIRCFVIKHKAMQKCV